jgi:hypothetical protein
MKTKCDWSGLLRDFVLISSASIFVGLKDTFKEGFSILILLRFFSGIGILFLILYRINLRKVK